MQPDELTRTAYTISDELAPAWSELLDIGGQVADAAGSAAPRQDSMDDGPAGVTARVRPDDPRGGVTDTDGTRTHTDDGVEATQIDADRTGDAAPAYSRTGGVAPEHNDAGDIAPAYSERSFTPGGVPAAPDAAEPASTLDMQQRQLAVLLSLERNTSRQPVAVAD